jgi:two-component system cell cycle response regulator DivK
MKKILIIEDHGDMRELLTWQIELMGFIPITAKRGSEGIEKALSEKPELIIMDIMMPGMDGWQATREIRAHAEMKDIPILAATAMFRDADLKNCLDAGCNGYIVKPFTFQELQGKVRELIPSASTTFPL